MTRQVRFDGRMSDAEALMWALEEDPVLRSTFANVSFLDRPPDFERFKERMAVAAEHVPRLRQRVVSPTRPGALPTWVDDPLFDLDYHVRRVAVPAPGDERQVLDLAALLSSDPFDRSRPLWQFWIVEGLADGRGAMVQKLHHTLADGEAGVRLSAMFLDLERDADEPMVLPEREPPPAPSLVDRVLAPVGTARKVATETLGAAGDPVGTARSVLRQVAVTDAARSPLWTERSLRRHLEVLQVPLADVKVAASGLGGTVNDLFVAAACGAAGAYHRERGAEVDLLRMAMPVSTRSSGGEGSNAFAPTRMLVPCGIVDPAERFAAVREVLTATKGERGLNLATSLVGVLAAVPAQLLTRVARQQVGTVDFTTSNVRGAPFELYFAGGRIEANHPIGPMAGTAFNLTTLSYRGSLDMGLVCDLAAIDDPVRLRELLELSFDELLAAAP